MCIFFSISIERQNHRYDSYAPKTREAFALVNCQLKSHLISSSEKKYHQLNRFFNHVSSLLMQAIAANISFEKFVTI